MVRPFGSYLRGGFGSWRVIAPAVAALLTAPALTSQAATVPSFRQNNVPDGSVLFGRHYVDFVGGGPTLISNMPMSGTLPSTAGLLSPWPSGSTPLSTPGGSSKAKGGAGHTE